MSVEATGRCTTWSPAAGWQHRVDYAILTSSSNAVAVYLRRERPVRQDRARPAREGRLLLLPGVDHNDFFFAGRPEYRAAWLDRGREANLTFQK